MTARILVVDDDPAVLKVVARMVRRLGLEVVTAARPSDALARFVAGERFAVILTDIEMPEMSGLDLLDTLAEGGIEIAMITMSGTYELSSATHLCKPFRLEELQAVLEARGTWKPVWDRR